MIRFAIGVFCVALLFPHTSIAQPHRPSLGAAADSNDAMAFLEAGRGWIMKDPKKAADAFYWAAQLNPLLADAYYGRRVALLLSDKRRLVKYWNADRRTLESNDIRTADSLYLYALTINPFLAHTLDGVLLDGIMGEIAQQASEHSDRSALEIQQYMDRYLEDAPMGFRAWKAYINGDYESALRLYASAAKKEKKKGDLLFTRGRILYQQGKVEEALPDMVRAVEELRKADKKELVYLYQSKALAEQSLGMIHDRLGNQGAAKEAFARALQEDLSYHPAHVQMALLALEARDTTAALNELDLAVQIRPADVAVRYTYGYLLGQANRLKDAEEQLRKIVELNPYFSSSYYTLGEVLEAQNRAKDAADTYRNFIARASLSDQRRALAEQRVQMIAGIK